MRQNVLLRQRLTPQRVRLANSTSFLARYERVSRKNFPPNMTVRQTRTTGLRNKPIRKKKVRFVSSTAQKVAKRIVRKYKTKEKEDKHKLGGAYLEI